MKANKKGRYAIYSAAHPASNSTRNVLWDADATLKDAKGVVDMWRREYPGIDMWIYDRKTRKRLYLDE